MPGLGVAAARLGGQAAKGGARLGWNTAKAAGQQATFRARSGTGGIDNKSTSWWNANSLQSRDWRKMEDLTVARSSKPKLKGYREAGMPSQQKPSHYLGPGTPWPTAPEQPAGSTVDTGRRHHFAHGVTSTWPQEPAGDIGTGHLGLPRPGHTLFNVNEEQDGWKPGIQDERLGRSGSFELGRGPLALGPGPNAVMPGETGSAVKKRRPAGGNPAAFKRLRADWPPQPGQPRLGI